jgi:hypothetical protein
MFPKICHFPHLEDWFAANPALPSNDQANPDRLVWTMARSLSQNDDLAGLRLWQSGLRQFFVENFYSPHAFIDAEERLLSLDFDFMRVACDIAEFAITNRGGADFLHLMQEIANQSELQVFRFLAAWTALNTNQLELCIEECEKIDTPFACVYTLQGQAFLESGQVNEAIDNLRLAVELGPNEVLSHFQLAKAYQVNGDSTKAWHTLEECQRLSADHPEIDGFKAMIALAHTDTQQSAVWLDEIVPKLMDHVRNDPNNPAMVQLAIEATLKLSVEARIYDLLQIANWGELRFDREFLAAVPTILKRLDHQGWKRATVELLGHLTGTSAQAK